MALLKGHDVVNMGKSSCLSANILDEFKVPEPGDYMGDDNDSHWVYNGKKHHQKNNLNPEWPTIVAPLSKLCDLCDISKPILIDIWDYDFECPHDDFMGFALISIFDLCVSCIRKCAIPLQPGKEGHKWGGRLFVEDIQICPTDSSLDPINTSTLLHLMSATGDLDKVRLLIGIQSESNPVLVKTAKSQSTALHFAVGQPSGCNPSIVRVLLDAKADVFAKTVDIFAQSEFKHTGHTPLCFHSLLSKTTEDTEVADMLIQKMVEIDPNNKVRRSARLNLQYPTDGCFTFYVWMGAIELNLTPSRRGAGFRILAHVRFHQRLHQSDEDSPRHESRRKRQGPANSGLGLDCGLWGADQAHHGPSPGRAIRKRGGGPPAP
jgi:hypothetical protein